MIEYRFMIGITLRERIIITRVNFSTTPTLRMRLSVKVPRQTSPQGGGAFREMPPPPLQIWNHGFGDFWVYRWSGTLPWTYRNCSGRSWVHLGSSDTKFWLPIWSWDNKINGETSETLWRSLSGNFIRICMTISILFFKSQRKHSKVHSYRLQELVQR